MKFIKLHPNAKDLTGRRFGRLVVLGPVGRYIDRSGRSGNLQWLCQCDCAPGKTTVVLSNNLKRCTTSCGCRREEVKRDVWKNVFVHGGSYRSEYTSWSKIKRRCLVPEDPAYRYYGARGITMCARWRDSFENFYADMGPKPTPKHSVERIDNNGNYEPRNCTWATAIEQGNNRRNSRKVEIFGRVQTVAQWAREFGVPRQAITSRISRGQPLEDLAPKP